MSSTRALSAAQSARIRSRFRQLIANEGVSQTEMARRLGISQQVFNRIYLGDPAGLHVAQRLAKYDRVPIESILDGVPTTLEIAIRDARDDERPLSEATKAAVRKIAIAATDDALERYDVARWATLLEEVERTLGPIVRRALSKPR